MESHTHTHAHVLALLQILSLQPDMARHILLVLLLTLTGTLSAVHVADPLDRHVFDDMARPMRAKSSQGTRCRPRWQRAAAGGCGWALGAAAVAVQAGTASLAVAAWT